MEERFGNSLPASVNVFKMGGRGEEREEKNLEKVVFIHT